MRKLQDAIASCNLVKKKMEKVGSKIEAKFANIILKNNKLWFTEWNCNELYYYDLQKKKVEFFCKFNKEKEYKENLFGEIIAYKYYLYIIPASASNIYRVNIINRELKTILLDFEEWEYKKNIAKFASAHILDSKLYLIGASCPLIVIYDCEDEKITYITKELGFLQADNNCDVSIFVRKTFLVGKKIYIPLCKKNYVGIFDTKDQKITYQKVGNIQCGFSSVCSKEGKSFWLTPINMGPIIYWEEKTGKCEELNFPPECVLPNSSFMNSLFLDDSIWLFPLNAKGIWKIDCDNNELSLFEKIPEEANWIYACCSERKLFCFSGRKNILYIIDKKTENVETIRIFLPESKTKYHQKNNYKIKIESGFYQNEEFFRFRQTIVEGEATKLEYFLLWIKNQKNNEKNNYSKHIGNIIYTNVI